MKVKRNDATSGGVTDMNDPALVCAKFSRDKRRFVQRSCLMEKPLSFRAAFRNALVPKG
jgi:hypothetical protein